MEGNKINFFHVYSLLCDFFTIKLFEFTQIIVDLLDNIVAYINSTYILNYIYKYYFSFKIISNIKFKTISKRENGKKYYNFIGFIQI